MIPLWTVWVVVALLAVRPVLELFDWFPRRGQEGVSGPGTLFLGDHLVVPLVAAVVAAVLTLDAAEVSEDELVGAAEDAADAVGGSTSTAVVGRFRVEVEDRLGHEVWLDRFDSASEQTPTGQTTSLDRIEVTASTDDGGAAVCVTITSTDVTPGPDTAYLGVSAGRCAAS